MTERRDWRAKETSIPWVRRARGWRRRAWDRLSFWGLVSLCCNEVIPASSTVPIVRFLFDSFVCFVFKMKNRTPFVLFLYCNNSPPELLLYADRGNAQDSSIVIIICQRTTLRALMQLIFNSFHVHAGYVRTFLKSEILF